MRTLRFGFSFAFVTCALPLIVDGQDITALQPLIDHAAVGGEVKVPKGNWNEPLRITKAIRLRGEDRDGCIIDVVSDSLAITASHPQGEVMIENLTVRWKLATSNRSNEPQAAITAKDAAMRLRSVSVVASDNFARCPSALTASGFAEVNIEKCTFEGFEFALQFGGGGKGNVIDCLVSKPGHCGITAGSDSTVNVSGTIVTGSRFHALRCTGATLNAHDNVIIANKNRGVYLGNKDAAGTIRDNVIQDNGTGISAFAESDVKVHNNYIVGSEFAAIDMRDGCRLTVNDNLLVGNGRAIVLFPESGTNRNQIGRNASADNETESEGFGATAPELVKVPDKVAAGAFAVEKPGAFGVSNAAKIKVVWERWTALQKSASAE